MRNTINKVVRIFTGVIMVAAVLLTAILMIKSDNDMAKDFTLAFREIGTPLDIFTFATYAIIGLAGLLVIFFAVYFIFIKPKAAKNALIGVAILVVIVVASFLMSSSAIDPVFVRDIADTVEVTPALSRQVGAGLMATYILGALSLLAIIYTSVLKLIKG